VTSETFNKHVKKLIWTKEEYEAETRILATGRVLRGIAYNSSTKGNKNKITENCESEKWGSTHRHTTAKIDDVSKENTDDVSKENTEKGNNKKVSFDNVTEEK